MRDLTQEILELVRFTSTNLPPDVEKELREAFAEEEPGSAAYNALETILNNVEMTRRNSTPICQDTGTPIFFVHYPEGWSPRAAARADQGRGGRRPPRRLTCAPTRSIRSNGKNTGNNLGDEHFPTIHFEEAEGDDSLTIELILKGGGCENVGAQYSLPDNSLKAGRDLEGVRRAVLDAAWQAQGEGCAPGFLGVSIGGDRGTSYVASKEALLRKVDDTNPDAELAALEERITAEANQLGIGPMGFGGQDDRAGHQDQPPPTACRLPSSSRFRTCAGPTAGAR